MIVCSIFFYPFSFLFFAKFCFERCFPSIILKSTNKKAIFTNHCCHCIMESDNDDNGSSNSNNYSCELWLKRNLKSLSAHCIPFAERLNLDLPKLSLFRLPKLYLAQLSNLYDQDKPTQRRLIIHIFLPSLSLFIIRQSNSRFCYRRTGTTTLLVCLIEDLRLFDNQRYC